MSEHRMGPPEAVNRVTGPRCDDRNDEFIEPFPLPLTPVGPVVGRCEFEVRDYIVEALGPFSGRTVDPELMAEMATAIRAKIAGVDRMFADRVAGYDSLWQTVTEKEGTRGPD